MPTMDYSKQSPFTQREGAWLTAAHNDDIFNWKSSNTRRFRTALGKAMAGTAMCEIACVGESTTAGTGEPTTNFAYPHYMRETLRNIGGVPIGGNGPVFTSYGSSAITSNFMTINGTWNRFGGAFYASSTDPASYITITGTGTVLQILYSRSGAATWSYSIDGAAAVTVTNGPAELAYITVAGLAPGAHSVVIRSVNSTTFYIYSVEFKETSGVTVGNYGVSGTKISDWVANAYYQNAATVTFRAPPLIIFQLSINDLAAAISVDAYITGLRTVLTRWLVHSDVVLATSNPAQGIWSQATWDLYQEAMLNLAMELDIPFFDFGSRYPSYTEANAMGLMFDTYHPNRNYYALRGNHHARAILT